MELNSETFLACYTEENIWLFGYHFLMQCKQNVCFSQLSKFSFMSCQLSN
jgi:hypothetical protein